MKKVLTATLLLCITICYGQYNYGLEIEQLDAKIKGKLHLEDGDENIFIGKNAGRVNTDGRTNCFIGSSSGADNSDGNNNSFYGFVSGFENTTGHYNSFFGSNSGQDNATGESNCFIGYASGLFNRTGSNIIAIGNGSGPTQMNANTSNRLYIDTNAPFSPGNDNPLIYGEFDNDLIRINGALEVTQTLHISETAKLEPQTTVPTCATGDMGTMYVDTGGVLYFCNGTAWKTVQLN